MAAKQKLVNEITIPLIGDDRGGLCVLEAFKQVPFVIQRVYYLVGTRADIARGFHAHRNLSQVAVAVSGKCRMVLDDGQTREELWLDSPTKGILIESMIWREMHDFSPDCVLLVLANAPYDETDYIRNYDDFLKAVN